MVTSVGIVYPKGGSGKTSMAANTGGLLADMGFRVLLIDADPQASLSKYFSLRNLAPNGIVEFMLDDLSEENIKSTISETIFPNLDIVLSNDLSDDVRATVAGRVDRAFLIKSRLTHPYIHQNYDYVLIDTQGAVGPVQDAVIFASTILLSPVKPDVLSVREINGMQKYFDRLAYGRTMGLEIPPLLTLIYAKDRTTNARLICNHISDHFAANLDNNQFLLKTHIPAAKAYTEAATMATPVHCVERVHAGKSDSACTVMKNCVEEIFQYLRTKFPHLAEHTVAKKEVDFFNNMQDLRSIPVENEEGASS